MYVEDHNFMNPLHCLSSQVFTLYNDNTTQMTVFLNAAEKSLLTNNTTATVMSLCSMLLRCAANAVLPVIRKLSLLLFIEPSN